MPRFAAPNTHQNGFIQPEKAQFKATMSNAYHLSLIPEALLDINLYHSISHRMIYNEGHLDSNVDASLSWYLIQLIGSLAFANGAQPDISQLEVYPIVFFLNLCNW